MPAPRRRFIDNCAVCHQQQGTGLLGAIPSLAGNPAVTAAEPYNVIAATLHGLPSDGHYGTMPSFAGRLSDQQIADVVNYVRTAWGNQGAPNATPRMVAAWRETVKVPDYGTQAASAFDCAQVGGAPARRGRTRRRWPRSPPPSAGATARSPRWSRATEAAAPDASPAQVVDALMAAYCPVVAAGGGEDYQKYARLKGFTLQAAADVSFRGTPAALPDVPVVWAVAAGKSLVARQPASLAGPLACPAADKIPADLVSAAAGLIGKPQLPVPGGAGGGYARELVTKNPKARPADIANALIVSYCGLVAADKGIEPATQHAYVEDFGQQVIQTLQVQP